MAKLNPSRACNRCGGPVKPGSDFLCAHLWGAVVLFHWSCFVRQMREHDRRSADIVAGAITHNGYDADSSAIK